jgi:hypothetical protein
MVIVIIIHRNVTVHHLNIRPAIVNMVIALLSIRSGILHNRNSIRVVVVVVVVVMAKVMVIWGHRNTTFHPLNTRPAMCKLQSNNSMGVKVECKLLSKNPIGGRGRGHYIIHRSMYMAAPSYDSLNFMKVGREYPITIS